MSLEDQKQEGSQDALNSNTSNKISFEELNRETMIAREEKKMKAQERYNIAYAEARDKITEGNVEKLKDASSQGKSQAILYEFEWVPEKTKEFDENGIQTVFHGNVRLLDILTKGWKIFKNMLEEYFNAGEEEKPYHCGYFKKFDEDKNITKWYIFVSWDTSRKEYKYDDRRTSYKSGGRGHGRAGGGPRTYGKPFSGGSSGRESL